MFVMLILALVTGAHLQALAAGAEDVQDARVLGGEEETTFVIGRHGTKVTGVFNFAKYLSKEAKKTLEGHDELLTSGDAQVSAITKYFGAPPSKLLPSAPACEESLGKLLSSSSLYVYSAVNERDVASAKAFAKGAGATAPPDQQSPFLLGEGKPLVAGCPLASEEDTEKGIGPDPTAWAKATYVDQFARLSSALGTELATIPLTWAGGVYVTFHGGLEVACRFSEHFMVEAIAGKDSPAFEKLGLKLEELPWLHETCHGFYGFYKNDVNLKRFGLELPVHLSAAMEAARTQQKSTLPSVRNPPSTRTVAYLGHDVNVDFVRMLLGAEWGKVNKTLCEDCTPFHVKMVLTLAQNRVRAEVIAPNIAEHRSGCHLKPADLKPVPLSCDQDGKGCPVEDFRRLLDGAVAARLSEPECLTAPTAEWWRDHLASDPGAPNKAWLVVGVALAFVFVGGLFFWWCRASVSEQQLPLVQHE